MKFFQSLKDHVLSLPIMLGISSESGIITMGDGFMSVMR